MKYINLSRVKIYTVLRNYFNSVESFPMIKQVLLQWRNRNNKIKARYQQNKKEFLKEMKKAIYEESSIQNNKEW